MAIYFRSFITLLVLLLGSVSATAGGTASSAISNVRFGALDLTPDDGATAGFDILAAAPSLFASIYTLTADYYAAGYPDASTPATVQLSLGDTSISTQTNGAPGDVAAVASGGASLGEYGMIGGTANQAVHFMLRPHTVLTIGGHLSTLAERHSAPGEYHDVFGMAYVGIIDGNGYTSTQFIRQSMAYADWPDRMTVEDDFMLAFANGSVEDRPVSVYFQALSNVTRIAAPVPEPSTLAMLCAGLLLVGRRVVIYRRAR